VVSLQIAEDSMNRRGKIAESMIALEKPELIDLFLTYQNEAIAARIFLDSSLIELDSGAEILEVGGGILALAVQLASEGFKVTTVEPVGAGFSGIPYIMSIFSKIAKTENVTFDLMESPIEDCVFDHKFDFIFSINVMEHLKDPYVGLVGIVNKLKVGCCYRFLCPNYDFPYEPHFGKWLVSRSDRAFFLPRKRANSTLISEDEIQGLYSSLNFLTLKKIKQSLKYTQIQLSANHNSLYEVMNRSIHDSGLKTRHRALSKVVRALFLLKLHYLAQRMPVH
jgi:2-polyprenyl-3-methyl-5-hydroxy-6-metoxy-1,4-benzoquinol methylase